MSFTAVVTAHAASPRGIVSNLLAQSRRPDEILVYVSDPTEEASEEIRLLEDVPGIQFFVVPNEEDWGHGKCARGLARASSDYVGWFNCDDAYTSDYVEKLMAATEVKPQPQIVFCDWIGRDRALNWPIEWRRRVSTRGNWIGKVGLLRAAGYVDRDYEADGKFIERIKKLHPRVALVDAVLYEHY